MPRTTSDAATVPSAPPPDGTSHDASDGARGRTPDDVPHDAGPAAPAPSGGALTELRSRAGLRELLDEPYPIVIDKVHDRLTADDTDILARSPFCLLATSDAHGACDVSPRGDQPGFTHVVDAGTLALPERTGNRRGDSLHNILDNPHAGLLYLIPGSRDVLRVNGRARILTDAPFFDALADSGRRPALAVLVEIEEIYRHCAQSLHRSRLWETEARETEA